MDERTEKDDDDATTKAEKIKLIAEWDQGYLLVSDDNSPGVKGQDQCVVCFPLDGIG